MTTLTCSGFKATPIAGGQIRLEIEAPTPDALNDRMSLREIAAELGKSIKQVDKLSRRVNNPLPIVRGNGHPYGFRHQINTWLMRGSLSSGPGLFPSHLGGLVKSVFAAKRTCRCGSKWPSGPGSVYCPDCQP